MNITEKTILNSQLNDCLLYNHEFNENFLLEKRDDLNWDVIAYNESINWSVELIDKLFVKFKNKFRRNDLLRNKKIAKEKDVVVSYFDLFNRRLLLENEFIEWDNDILDRLKGKLSIQDISKNLAVGIEAIRQYKAVINWKGLSMNSKIVIDNDFLAEFEAYIDWKNISYNRRNNWEEIDLGRFAHRWDWESLSKNTEICWSEEILDTYSSKLDWQALSNNPAVRFNTGNIQKYSRLIDFRGLSRNTVFDWNFDFIEQNRKQLNFGLFGLSWNHSVPWNLESLLSRSSR